MTDLDLTPREPSGDRSRDGRRRSLRNVLIVGTLCAVLCFVLYQAITSARLFFYNVDEAVALQGELGSRNFRMQGTVIAENGVDEVGALLFEVAFNDETVVVRHLGDEPSNLFTIGEKVVVEGHWQGGVFQSHQVLVKHSEQYIEDNSDRLSYELEPELELEPASPAW